MKNIIILIITASFVIGCSTDKNSLVENDSFDTSTMITDIDGNNYATIQIGTQTWIQKNLNVTKYRNGDPIPQVTDPTIWRNLTTGAWCYYNYNSANGVKYGKLYNWYALNDSRGLAPTGWRIPIESDWTILIDFLGGIDAAGGKMKEIGTTNWTSPNSGATNESRFLALPAGYLDCGNNQISFKNLGTSSQFWSSQYNFAPYERAWVRTLSNQNTKSFAFGVIKTSGLSVRCIKN